MQLSRNGGPGHSSGVFIRGAFSGQTVVLVDGVRIGSATLGQPSFDAVPLSQIERIEVLRGPGSSLYGADAIGGVVQIFTQRGDAGTQVDASAAFGGYGSRELSGGVRSRQGAWDLAAGLSHEQSDGVSALRPGDQFGNHNPDRDGYQLDAAHARIGFAPAAGHRIGLTLLRSRQEAQYDASEYLRRLQPGQHARLPRPPGHRGRSARLARHAARRASWPALRAQRSVDDSRSGGNTIDVFRTTRQQVGGQLAWASGALGQLVVALEHGSDRAFATPIGRSVERRNECRGAGTQRRRRHLVMAGRRAPRRQLRLRRRHHRPPGRRRAPAAAAEAARAGRHHLPRAQLQRPVLPGLRRRDAAARARAQRRDRPELAQRRHGSRVDGVPQPRARPDRLRRRPQLLPARPVATTSAAHATSTARSWTAARCRARSSWAAGSCARSSTS